MKAILCTLDNTYSVLKVPDGTKEIKVSFTVADKGDSPDHNPWDYKRLFKITGEPNGESDMFIFEEYRESSEVTSERERLLSMKIPFVIEEGDEC